LPEAECRLFRQLAVFSGGWTLEAAEAVAGESDVLDGLAQLANKSLVLVDEAEAEARYRYLETIRQYALDKLSITGEAEPARDCHFNHFATIAMDAPKITRGAEPHLWRKQFEGDVDNHRVAFEWGLDRFPEAALEFATNLVLAMLGAGFVESGAELLRWVRVALARVEQLPPVEGETAARREVLRGYGLLAECELSVSQGVELVAIERLAEGIAIARAHGDRHLLGYCLMFWVLTSQIMPVPGAEAAAHEGLAILREVGDKWAQAMTLMQLARMAAAHGALQEANAHTAEAVQLTQEIRNPWHAAMIYMQLGLFAIAAGDRERARASLVESGRRFREYKDRFFGTAVQSMLAHLDRQEGDVGAALATYRETILKWKELGTRAAVAHELECMGFIASACEEPERAARLLGAAEALRELINTPMAEYEREEYACEVAALRMQLDATTIAQAWARGRTMTMDDAIEYAQTDATE
jgi:hypothetical protein